MVRMRTVKVDAAAAQIVRSQTNRWIWICVDCELEQVMAGMEIMHKARTGRTGRTQDGPFTAETGKPASSGQVWR